MKIPVNFNPRWYQQELLEALEWGIKIAVICWARRGGKDFTCFAYACKKMIEEPMNVVLVFPEKEQGRKAFWENVENDGFLTIDHMPKVLRARTDNTEMRFTLKNGSSFFVLGASNADALRGANGKLYIFSEFVDIPKSALDVIRPIVANNGGQIIINSTPKIDGISGASFKQLFDRAEKSEKQFASRVTADNFLDAETLEELRQEAIEENGNDFFFQQEYMCDWGQASSSNYYGHILQSMLKKKKIGHYPYDSKYPVYTVWDWGMSDNTAIGFFQFYLRNGKPTPVIIDSYETHDIGIKQLVQFIKTKPYNYAWHFFPHDTKVRDSDAIERIEKFRDEGLINSSILKREPVEDGITRVVESLPKSLINEETTTSLRRKLSLYKRKFNPLTGDYIGPEHKSESHYSDMIRYMYVALEKEFDKKTCEHFYSQAFDSDEVVEYEAEEITTSYFEPSYY